MGMLSALGRFFGGLVFTLSLGFLVVAIALAQFTDYANLQPLLSGVISQQLTKTTSTADLSNLDLALKQQCGGNAEQTSVDTGGQVGNVSLKCSDVLQARPSQLPDLLAKATFDKLYYKQYACDFLQCMQQLEGNDKYMVITTSLGNKFFNSIILPLAAATVIGLIISIVSIRTWYEIFKSVGISCLLIGIAYFTFPFLEASLSQVAPAEQASIAQQIVSSMFASMKTTLLIIFIAGVVLTVAGYVTGYFIGRKAKRTETKKENAEK